MATFGGFTAAVLTAAELNTAGGAWATWTPTITSWTQGNGTVVAVYEQVGRTVHCMVRITYGTMSSGFVQNVSLPKTEGRLGAVGHGWWVDNSAATGYQVTCVVSTTGQVSPSVINSAGTYATLAALSATVPVAVATADYLWFSLTYEAAVDGT